MGTQGPQQFLHLPIITLSDQHSQTALNPFTVLPDACLKGTDAKQTAFCALSYGTYSVILIVEIQFVMLAIRSVMVQIQNRRFA